MKRSMLIALVLAFLTTSLHGLAQETKTKEKSATGEKTKTKTESGQTKIKSETADGQEAKMKKEDDKVVLKGEGVGNQFDTAMNRAAGTNMNLDVVRQEINNSNQLWGQAFVKGDSVTMVGLYHSEARLYPPNMAMMNNRSDLGRMIAGIPRGTFQRAQITTTDVIGAQDLVVETGTYEMADASKVVDRGKYIVVWKQENGRWRIYRDIWNSDMAATPR
jgi:ketosteroid isomerase-like protein